MTAGEVDVSVADYVADRDAIHDVRREVFVVGQSVPAEIEVDGQDPVCVHVLARWGSESVGTGRMLPDGHIGRVAVRAPFRNRGIGTKLIQQLIEVAREEGLDRVFLGSQVRATAFYERLGFQQCGSRYVEAGIEHTTMEKSI